MTPFEYLSVLVSIIVGLALTQLLSGAARLIQLRRRIAMHPATLCWMALLFLIDVQVWWVAFERRQAMQWTFFAFLLYLLIPIGVFLLSYLILPDLGDEDAPDLRANFEDNRTWFFGLLAALPLVSLAEQALREHGLPMDADVGFRLAFVALSLLAAGVRSARYQLWNAAVSLAAFVGYVVVLFLRLR
ncbi:MAG: hypothetical protein HOQ02_03995 [Lysobacter sp.]|nr:hypothetical protein [Lysobacter sp.]